nr:hypothetical protein [Mycobacterium lepraemurium]
MRDKDVVREAQRWTDGERGEIVDDPDVLADADLTAFVTEAIKIGAHALSATGQAQDARVLERMMKEVGEKAADTSAKAAEVAERAVKSASDAVGKAAENAKKAITDADKATRRELQESTKAAVAEVRRLFGGQNPEVVERLMPVLEKFGADLDAKAKSTFPLPHRTVNSPSVFWVPAVSCSPSTPLSTTRRCCAPSSCLCAPLPWRRLAAEGLSSSPPPRRKSPRRSGSSRNSTM